MQKKWFLDQRNGCRPCFWTLGMSESGAVLLKTQNFFSYF